MAAISVRGGAVLLAAGLLPVLLAACGTQPRPGGASTQLVAAGLDDCGDGWAPTGSGRQVLRVHNSTVAGEEVYLENSATHEVYLDIESLGAGARTRADVTLGAGSYRFVCLPADGEPVTGPTVRIHGPRTVAGQTPAARPVTRNDLIPVLKRYQRWVAGRLPVLQVQVARLRDDVMAGDRTAARLSWLAAHRTYETLGAAYGAFGDLGTEIDGLPSPGRTARADTHLEGFHRIEALLWGSAAVTAASRPAVRLVTAVTDLRSAFPQARIDPTDIGLRAHEIVEDAIQLELTGRTDAGSHSNLATIDANLTGSRQALVPLTDILRSRDPAFTATEQSLDAAQRLVRSHRQPDGSWDRLDRLSRRDREEIDARLDAAAELLAPVAALTDPRRDS